MGFSILPAAVSYRLPETPSLSSASHRLSLRNAASESTQRNPVQRISYHRTKNSKSRVVPIAQELEELVKAALPFGDCYKKFGGAIEAAGIELSDGQLTHVLRHTFASHYNGQRGRHSDFAAGSRSFVSDNDHALCPFQPWTSGRCGQFEPVDCPVWTECGRWKEKEGRDGRGLETRKPRNTGL